MWEVFHHETWVNLQDEKVKHALATTLKEISVCDCRYEMKHGTRPRKYVSSSITVLMWRIPGKIHIWKQYLPQVHSVI